MSAFRKQKPDWPIFLLGFFAVGFLLTAAILFVSFSRRVLEDIPGQERIAALQSPAQVTVRYSDAMREVHTLILASADPLPLLFDTVEAWFFEVRVPDDMRAAHLNALLAVQQLRAWQDASDMAAVRAELARLVEPLIAPSSSSPL